MKISQTIVVNTDGSAKVDTEGQKQLAQGFQVMMEAYTRKEMRQGGSIYNFVKLEVSDLKDDVLGNFAIQNAVEF